MISPSLVYDPTTEQVSRAIVSARAYLVKVGVTEDQFFSWKSGIKAPVYTNCRILARSPASTAIISRALGSSIRANFPRAEYIIGVAEAGIIWSTLSAQELSLPQAFVQKSEKGHGVGGRIACDPPRGVKAVLVDDLVASGGSLEEAIEVLWRERRINVIGIQSIVNWDFMEMRERFRRLNVPVRALVSFPNLLNAAREANLIGTSAVQELRAFYQDPQGHTWNTRALEVAQIGR